MLEIGASMGSVQQPSLRRGWAWAWAAYSRTRAGFVEDLLIE